MNLRMTGNKVGIWYHIMPTNLSSWEFKHFCFIFEPQTRNRRNRTLDYSSYYIGQIIFAYGFYPWDGQSIIRVCKPSNLTNFADSIKQEKTEFTIKGIDFIQIDFKPCLRLEATNHAKDIFELGQRDFIIQRKTKWENANSQRPRSRYFWPNGKGFENFSENPQFFDWQVLFWVESF